MSQVYVGLGSNLNEPEKNVLAAASELAASTGIHRAQLSPLYQTKPVGYLEQPDFVNAVVGCETLLVPEEILSICLVIEKKFGRVREGNQFGPRIIDCDVLLYDNQVINMNQLQVPHPRMFERPFVLFPLYDIAPELKFPDGSNLRDRVNTMSGESVNKLTEMEA